MTEVPFKGDPRAKIPEPEIREVGKTTLIGVNHDVPLTAIVVMPIYPRIVDKLRSAQHLLLEGTRDIIERNAVFDIAGYGLEEFGFETFRLRGKKEDIHCLEQTKDPIALAMSHGIDVNTAILVHSLVDIVDPRVLDPNTREESLQGIVDKNRVMFPTLGESMTREELYEQYQVVTDNFINFRNSISSNSSLEQFVAGFKTLNVYMRFVRDFEIIGPELLQTMPTLTGETVVMMGNDHMDNLEHILRTGKVEPVPVWPEFERGFEPLVRTCTTLFAEVANGRI